MYRRLIATAVTAAVAGAAAVALPVLGDDSSTAAGVPAPSVMPASDPPEPTPAPGETNIPPVGDASEDDAPATPAERDRALEHLRAVAACARTKGHQVPEPVSDGAGVYLGWDGPPAPALEAAIRECDPGLR